MSQRAGIGYLRRNAAVYVYIGNLLQLTNIILGMTAVILTLTVASKPFATGTNYPLLGYLAAVFTAALAFVKAEKRGKDWAKAGRHLEDAIGRFDFDQTYTFDEVAKARTEAVSMAAGEA